MSEAYIAEKVVVAENCLLLMWSAAVQQRLDLVVAASHTEKAFNDS
jgi:hypothetical protein